MTACALLWALISFLPQSTACQDAASCTRAALEAEARNDYEAFHDLAWKAAAKGKPKDPELMLLVARAQSLSGRPGDALVMLRRIAELGVAPDTSGEEFRRVRELPAWPEVEALVASVKDRRPVGETQPAVPAPRAAAAAKPALPSASPAPRVSEAPGARSAAAPPASPLHSAADAVRLAGSDLDAVGLAYDSVSRRFVLGDRRENRLIVADEVSKRVNALIGADSGGFGTLTALEVDRQRGDLWVTSETGGRTSVHKLQLVSGRVLSTLEVPGKWGPAAIADVAVADGGRVVLLDAEGSRLLVLAPPGRTISRAIPLHVDAPGSVAAAGSVAYVCYPEGLLLVDLDTAAVRKVRGSRGVVLTGLRRIKWHTGALVAIQRLDEATAVVRIGLDPSGTSATSAARLDGDTPGQGSPLTISRGTAYYLAGENDAAVIRSVPVR